MKHKKILVALSLVLAVTVGCKNEVEKAKAPAAPAQVVKAEPASEASGSEISGKVVETMDASNYTYVQVDTGKDKLWAAGPKTTVKVGDEVYIAQGSPMHDFESKALKRKFDKIIFTSSIMVGGAGKAAAGQPAAERAPAPAVTAVDLKGITKAPGGKTVAEVFAERGALNGKMVKVRGKVVKFMSGIMGKNWMHVKDGSGSAGTDDLVVTSNEQAKVGDTVLIDGKLASDKDFGAGYRYDAIVEDAKVTVEK